MLGINQVNVFRPSGHQVAHVMQDACARVMAVASFSASRTTIMFEVPTASNDSRFGQILGANDALGSVRQILSRSRHGKALLGQAAWPRNLRHFRDSVTTNPPAMMLKTHLFR